MNKIEFGNTSLGMLDGFEDATDCAILNDDQCFEADAMSEDANEINELIDDQEDELIDVNTDYTNDVPYADFVDIDADDIIAAERDIAHDPFEDDEIIDAAIGSDNIEIADDGK